MWPSDNGQFILLPMKGDKGGWGALHRPSPLLLTPLILSYTWGKPAQRGPKTEGGRRTAVGSDRILPFGAQSPPILSLELPLECTGFWERQILSRENLLLNHSILQIMTKCHLCATYCAGYEKMWGHI